MKLKMKRYIGIASLVAFTMSNAFAQVSKTINLADEGGHSGNGGGTWVCRDANKAITRIELVDLWEAENDPNTRLHIKRSSDPVEAQIAAALSPLENDLKKAVSDSIADTDELISVGRISKREKLSVVNDALYSIQPNESEYCPKGSTLRYEQIANYRDDGTIVLDQDLYNNELFSNTDRSALHLHEPVYFQDRKPPRNASDSRRTRKIVGRLFSQEGPSKKTITTLQYLYLRGKAPFVVSAKKLAGVGYIDLSIEYEVYDQSQKTAPSLVNAVFQAWQTKDKPGTIPVKMFGSGASTQVKRIPIEQLNNTVLDTRVFRAGASADIEGEATLILTDSETGKVIGKYRTTFQDASSTAKVLSELEQQQSEKAGYWNKLGLNQAFLIVYMNEADALEK